MTEIARELYKDVCDLYREADLQIDVSGWGIGSETVATPAYTGVICLIKPSSELLVPIPGLGQSDYDITDTMDVVYFLTSQETGANWFLQLKTPGHPEFGTWYRLMGDATFYHNPPEAAHRRHFLKRSLKPEGVPYV